MTGSCRERPFGRDLNSTNISSCSIADQHNQKSFVKNKIFLTLWFILDTITLSFYRYNFYKVMSEDCLQAWNFKYQSFVSSFLTVTYVYRHVYIYLYIFIYKSWKHCVFPVITTMALCQLMLLRTWRTNAHVTSVRFENSVCLCVVNHLKLFLIYIYIYNMYIYIYIYIFR